MWKNYKVFETEEEARDYIVPRFDTIVVLDEYGKIIGDLGYPTFELIKEAVSFVEENKRTDTIKLLSRTRKKDAKIYKNVNNQFVLHFCYNK